MRREVAALLDRLHRHGVAHDAEKTDRTDRLRNLEPQSAQLLSVLVRATKARSVLELGTSNGYSTVWLAEAAQANNGHLTSVELDPARSAEAATNLQRAGLASVVDLRIGDAGQYLADCPEEQWDFIFLDAERSEYVTYWPSLHRALSRGALLAVDNVLSHAEQVAQFRELIAADETVREAVAPTGAGILLVVADRPSGGER